MKIDICRRSPFFDLSKNRPVLPELTLPFLGQTSGYQCLTTKA